MADDSGGFDRYHVAIFGAPGMDRRFEWVVTGRHITLRAEGNDPTGASFRGPIFYGHGRGGQATSRRYQTRAGRRDLFTSLDASQKARALVSRSVPAAPRVIGCVGELGLSVAELDGARKAMVQSLLSGVLQPFRVVDAGGIPSCLRDAQSLDTLRLTYYQDGETGQNGLPAIWKLEGPAFSGISTGRSTCTPGSTWR